MTNEYKILEVTPKLLTALLLLTLILPAMSLLIGIDLGFSQQVYSANSFYVFVYRWLLSILAGMIVLLSITDYWTTHNELVFILGCAYAFIAYFNTLFTLSYQFFYNNPQLLEMIHANVWLFSNTGVGFLISVGITLVLLNVPRMLRTIILVSLLMIMIIFVSIWLNHFPASRLELVKALSDQQKMQIFGTINLVIYGYLIFLYMRLKKRFPSQFISILWYLGLIQCVLSLYVIIGVFTHYDNSYVGSSFFQFSCFLLVVLFLVVRYLRTYLFIVQKQKQIKAEKEKFELLSYQDPLTSLANRRAFEIEAARTIAHAQRHGGHFALLFLDLDDFKKVNDTLGHEAGDELLQQVAKRLSESLRLEDYYARLGGDEFGILLVHLHDHILETLVNKLVTILEKPYVVKDKIINIGVSVGTACYPDEGNTYRELLNHADFSMLKIKKGSKQALHDKLGTLPF